MAQADIYPRRRRPTAAVRLLVLVLPLAAGAVVWPVIADAAAALEHLGFAGSSSSVAPSCPAAPCEAITTTTGFQASIIGTHNAMVVRRPGRVTSWSITLGAANAAQVAYFDKLAHGPAQAGLVILRQGAGYRFRVAAAGPLVTLESYFGKTTSFALAPALPVLPGEVVALTVPTWAPALAVGLDAGTAWRASRARARCDNVFAPTAQTLIGALTKYLCVYRTARLTYGAVVADDRTAPAPAQRSPTTKPAPRKPEAKPSPPV